VAETHLKEPAITEEKSLNIFFLIILSIILFFCAITLRSYHLTGQPPLWDNLAYQQQTLIIIKNWFDGNRIIALNMIWESMNPAYLISLAIGFILFGLTPIAPYIVSAFFGIGCMIAVYLLCQELGISKRTAFWGVISFSLLPSFIYQNFLQTRNDFPLAFFITLSWVFLLRGIKRKDIKITFFAGIISGVGTLFKASAPGYVAWGILAFLVMPEKHIKINLKDRMKLALIFFTGAVFSCGWHFLPHLSQVVNYYTKWGNAKTLVMSQYNLQNNWMDFFFYLQNIIFLHLGAKIALGIVLVGGGLLIRLTIKRSTRKLMKDNSKELSLIFLVLMAGILPIIFISLRQSFSSLGDVPILPLFSAVCLAFFNRVSYGVTVPKFLLISLLPVCLILSISNLTIIEKQFSAKDINMLSRETMKIRKKFGLSNTPMMQVFSHPIYNVDSLSWLWLMNPKIDKSFVNEPAKIHKIVFPENSKIIASKLKRFPLLIISEFSGATIKGERFATMNRLHSKINAAIENQGQFVKIRSLELEEGRFPIHFMINKKFLERQNTGNPFFSNG